MKGFPVKSSVVLWVLAPLVVTLSTVRPPNPRSDRASNIPERLGEFVLKGKKTITRRHERLLGTKDVAWWVFADDEDNEIYLTAVFHDSNWKSLHPPHICIRGSNFDISADDSVRATTEDGRQVNLGRLRATLRSEPRRDYVSLYAYVGQGFITPSYTGFYLRHAPRALVRQATSGFLMRVEAFVGADGRRATEERCWRMFQRFLPVGEALIGEP